MTVRILTLALLFLGPLLQGWRGASDPQAILFAPLIAIAVLPLTASRALRDALRLAAMFLGIGVACLGLWWLGGRLPPLALPAWAPVAVSLVGAGLALWTGRPR